MKNIQEELNKMNKELSKLTGTINNFKDKIPTEQFDKFTKAMNKYRNDKKASDKELKKVMEQLKNIKI